MDVFEQSSSENSLIYKINGMSLLHQVVMSLQACTVEIIFLDNLHYFYFDITY